MRLILYSKPGCHLCEGLQEKLEQIQSLQFELEVRDITSRDEWFQAYQYEIPVLFLAGEVLDEEVLDEEVLAEKNDAIQNSNPETSNASLQPIPRPSPRSTVSQLEQMLQKYISKNRTQ